jgi:glycerol-3-phosphate O-acyltransferase
MTSVVALPLWLALLLVAFAVLSAVEWLLLPGVRWWLRRRINRVIGEINTRLRISIRPFQLTKRQVLIDRLVFDPKVMEAIDAHAREHNMPREAVQAKVLRYAREIVPAFNAYAYFRLGYWLARRIARFLYRVRAGFADDARLAGIEPNATVVFVMNHRSNMDYVLVGFLAAEQSALSYAVGEWARIWPLHQLIRSMGAYFVRRKSNDPVYRRVLERYVHMATEEGVCQAVFPEGGLTRDGKLREPKLGILDYMLRSHDPDGPRDVVFVPVGINYDRVLEDRTLVRMLDPEAPRRSRWFVARTTLGFIFRNLRLMLRSRWQRFGYAAVAFGKPLSYRAWCHDNGINPSGLEPEARFVEIEKLARKLLGDIAREVPVLPIPLLCRVLADAGEGGAREFDLRAAFYRAAEAATTQGRFVVVPPSTREHTFSTALHMLRLRRLVVEADEVIRVDPGARDVVTFYANSIVLNGSETPSS